MRFGSFIIACTLALAVLLFAERRPATRPQECYSKVVDLTRTARVKADSARNSGTDRVLALMASPDGSGILSVIALWVLKNSFLRNSQK